MLGGRHGPRPRRRTRRWPPAVNHVLMHSKGGETVSNSEVYEEIKDNEVMTGNAVTPKQRGDKTDGVMEINDAQKSNENDGANDNNENNDKGGDSVDTSPIEAKREEATKRLKTQPKPVTNEISELQLTVFVEGVCSHIRHVNPLRLTQLISEKVGPAKIFMVKTGLKIVCSTIEKRDALLNTTALGETQIRVSEPRCLRKEMDRPIQRVIKGVPHEISDEEIMETTSVLSARRIFRGRGPKATPTATVVLKFRKDDFKDGVRIGYMHFKTHEFIPIPTRCYKCQLYGHISRNCHQEEEHCSICSGPHSHRDCPDTTKEKCANCGGEHAAASPACPRFIIARKVAAVVASTGTSYRDALMRVTKESSAEKTKNSVQTRPACAQDDPALSASANLAATTHQSEQAQQQASAVTVNTQMVDSSTQTDTLEEEQMETEAIISVPPERQNRAAQTEECEQPVADANVGVEVADRICRAINNQKCVKTTVRSWNQQQEELKRKLIEVVKAAFGLTDAELRTIKRNDQNYKPTAEQLKTAAPRKGTK